MLINKFSCSPSLSFFSVAGSDDRAARCVFQRAEVAALPDARIQNETRSRSRKPTV